MSLTRRTPSVSHSMLLWALVASGTALAGWTKAGEATARFKATGPAGFKIIGVSKTVEVADDGKALTVSVKLADLDTDNALRNRHMQEDLEAAKFPACALSVPLDTLKEGVTDFDGKGTFALHGKTKEVPFKYTAKCAGEVCDVEGSAELNLKDYEVKVRSYLGITVKPEVTVSAKFQVKR